MPLWARTTRTAPAICSLAVKSPQRLSSNWIFVRPTSPSPEVRTTHSGSRWELQNPSQQHTAADYLRKLDITSDRVRLQLHLMRPLRAKVTIEVPTATPELTANLGRGELTLAADQIAGKHVTINVGYGRVDFQGNPDAYETLQVNVGLGSMHDNRTDGETHHFIVARSFAGKGRGSITVNVGAGRVDLNPGQSQPI